MRAILLLLVLGLGVAVADTPSAALVLDHDMLTAMVTSKEPEARIGYTRERLEFRTRRSALVVWVDVLLTARFERVGDRVQLVAKSLRAAGRDQRGMRFEQAKAGLLKLVNVKTAAQRVEIYRAGELVYSQVLDPAAAGEGK